MPTRDARRPSAYASSSSRRLWLCRASYRRTTRRRITHSTACRAHRYLWCSLSTLAGVTHVQRRNSGPSPGRHFSAQSHRLRTRMQRLEPRKALAAVRAALRFAHGAADAGGAARHRRRGSDERPLHGRVADFGNPRRVRFPARESGPVRTRTDRTFVRVVNRTDLESAPPGRPAAAALPVPIRDRHRIGPVTCRLRTGTRIQ
jgi:hypothetical protein